MKKTNHDVLFMKNGDILIAVERKFNHYDYYQKSEGLMIEKITKKKFFNKGKRAYHWEFDIEAKNMVEAQEIALDGFYEKSLETERQREMGYNAFGIA
jgi:hypothetical protein